MPTVCIDRRDKRGRWICEGRIDSKELARDLVHRYNCHARLLDECKMMLSRIAALMAVPEAMDALCAEDMFGKQYKALLAADKRELQKDITAAEAP